MICTTSETGTAYLYEEPEFLKDHDIAHYGSYYRLKDHDIAHYGSHFQLDQCCSGWNTWVNHDPLGDSMIHSVQYHDPLGDSIIHSVQYHDPLGDSMIHSVQYHDPLGIMILHTMDHTIA
jgi:hypothetical protein